MEGINYLSLLILFVVAWMVPMLLSWLEVNKIPAVIAEIVMGVIIGPYVLGWVKSDPFIDFLASTGFLFLIFLAGLEIDISRIMASLPKGKIKMSDISGNPLVLAIFIYFGSLLLALPVSWLISLFLPIDIFFFTLLFPTVALSIIVPILKAEGKLAKKFGQVILMEGAIATIMSIILISIYSGVLQKGFEVELLLFSVIFAVFLVNYFVGRKIVRIRTFQKLLYTLEHAASQIRVRGTVALLFLFVVVAQLINTEAVMGAFFAGTLLALFVSKERSALLFKLDGMSYGFFIPIFFIMVGVNLDLSSLSNFGESIPLVLAIVLGFILTQIIPSMVMARLFGLKNALAGGILLTARLGLTIATAQIGLMLQVIDTGQNAGIVASGIIASLLSPLLYKVFSGHGETIHHIYILGGSRASLLLAERFQLHGISCITLIKNRDILSEFERKSIPYQEVHELNTEQLGELQINPSDEVIVLTESKNLNQQLTRFLKQELGHSKIITSMQSATHDLVEEATDIKFVDQNAVLANHIEDMIMRPDAITSISQSFDLYRVEEIKITRKEIHRKLVKEIAFPPSGSLVIQRRGGEIFIPHGDTHLLLGDVITVIGNSIALTDFRNILEG